MGRSNNFSSLTWIIITIMMGIIGAMASFIYFLNIFYPKIRMSIASPASTAWSGFVLFYWSTVSFGLQYSSLNSNTIGFHNIAGFLGNTISYYLLVVYLMLSSMTCIGYEFTETPNHAAAFLNACIAMQIYQIMEVNKAYVQISRKSINNRQKQSTLLQIQPDIYVVTEQLNIKSAKDTILYVIASIFHTIFLLILFLLCLQVLYESFLAPVDIDGEQYVVVKHNNYDIRIRTYCTGPSTTTNPAILFESGGGSSGIDFMELQERLQDTYTVCSYDRAGYGKSWQGPYPQDYKSTMQIMVKALREVGFPIDSSQRVVCIGHSVGGQVCRYYAKNLASIKGIIMLDSVPSQVYFYKIGLQNGQTAEEVQAEQEKTALKVRLMALAWPLFIGTPVVGRGKDFVPKQYQHWKNWQIITTKNWYAQNLGEWDTVYSCDASCFTQPITSSDNMLTVPVVAISAGNSAITCDDLGYTGTTCTSYITNRDVIIQIQNEQAQLGSPWGYAEQCDGICEHDFVWVKVDYVYGRIIHYLPLF